MNRRDFDPCGGLPTGRMLLEASAGTGKTHTITSLVVRMVAEEGYALPRLLVVTFTRAAAAELRERVRTRLAGAALAVERAVADPSALDRTDEVVAHLVVGADGPHQLAARARALRQASEQLDESTITTIHGFCQRMLTISALETGVDFDAELVDDERALVGEVVDDLTDRRLRHADPAWYAYLRDVAAITQVETEQAAIRAVAGARPHLLPDPDAAGADPMAPWRAAWNRFREVWRAHRDGLYDDLKELAAAKRLKNWQRTGGVDPFQTNVESLNRWLEADPPFPDHARWAQDCGLGWLLGRFRDGPERGVHPVLDAAIDVVDAVNGPAGLLLAGLARDARTELDARKHRQKVLAYDDQLRRLADALDDPDRRDTVVAAIRARYDAALIDEFQDTDPLQWRIFSAAFADATLVLIGDPKQAIYGFRGADLPTYLRAAATVGDAATLPVNWRSDQRYVDAVNALFATPAAFGVEGIAAPAVRAVDHHHRDRLRWSDGQPRPTLRLRFVPHATAAPDGATRGPRIAKWWANRHLPVDVATQVRALLADAPVLTDDDTGAERVIEPGDVAVLVRTNRQARLVHERLMDADIPATLTRAGSVFATTEADELLRLLEAMAEPGREPLARAAAAARLFPWRAVDLLDPDAAADWDAFTERLRDWGQRWREDGVMAALRTVFADEQVWARLLATTGGDRATANVWHLAERLHAAEQAERLGATALIGWLRAAREEALADDAAQAGEDAELRLERDDAAVQVITVHASKGLQYPVVLCPFLWDGALLRQHEEKVLGFHDEDHDDRLTLDLRRDPRQESKARHLAMAKRQRHAESLRLAYVALTRAKHLSVVWWGRFADADTSPLAGLLHRQPGADPYEAGRAAALDVDDETLRADLDRLAHRTGVIGVEALTRTPTPPALLPPSAATGPTTELAAAVFDRELDDAWGRTSFSALTRSAHGRDDRPSGEMGREDDEDDDVDLAGLPRPDDAGYALPLADLPRGAEFGDAVHHILEDTDFTVAADDPDGLAVAVERHVARSPVLDAGHHDQLVRGLAGMLATPLGADLGDVRLDGIARRDRLDELGFELPLAGGTAPDGKVTLRRLVDRLGDHPDGREAADALATLGGAPPVRGFLTGSIDLLARAPVGGVTRYLVVDYKSTWLGDRGDPHRPAPTSDRSTPWHYRPDALAAAMRPHTYHLQALLYLVAAHRYLRSRLGAAYDADRDLGGVAYLFVRGMAGPLSRRADGTSDGVWRWQPSGALVADVSDLLATGRERTP